MNTVKRWLAGFLSFAMIFTSAAFSNMTVFAQKASDYQVPAASERTAATVTLSSKKGIVYETITLDENGDFQNAIDHAKAGDTIAVDGTVILDKNVYVGVTLGQEGNPTAPKLDKDDTIKLDLTKATIRSTGGYAINPNNDDKTAPLYQMVSEYEESNNVWVYSGVHYGNDNIVVNFPDEYSAEADHSVQVSFNQSSGEARSLTRSNISGSGAEAVVVGTGKFEESDGSWYVDANGNKTKDITEMTVTPPESATNYYLSFEKEGIEPTCTTGGELKLVANVLYYDQTAEAVAVETSSNDYGKINPLGHNYGDADEDGVIILSKTYDVDSTITKTGDNADAIWIDWAIRGKGSNVIRSTDADGNTEIEGIVTKCQNGISHGEGVDAPDYADAKSWKIVKAEAGARATAQTPGTTVYTVEIVTADDATITVQQTVKDVAGVEASEISAVDSMKFKARIYKYNPTSDSFSQVGSEVYLNNIYVDYTCNELDNDDKDVVGNYFAKSVIDDDGNIDYEIVYTSPYSSKKGSLKGTMSAIEKSSDGKLKTKIVDCGVNSYVWAPVKINMVYESEKGSGDWDSTKNVYLGGDGQATYNEKYANTEGEAGYFYATVVPETAVDVSALPNGEGYLYRQHTYDMHDGNYKVVESAETYKEGKANITCKYCGNGFNNVKIPAKTTGVIYELTNGNKTTKVDDIQTANKSGVYTVEATCDQAGYDYYWSINENSTPLSGWEEGAKATVENGKYTYKGEDVPAGYVDSNLTIHRYIGTEIKKDGTDKAALGHKWYIAKPSDADWSGTVTTCVVKYTCERDENAGKGTTDHAVKIVTYNSGNGDNIIEENDGNDTYFNAIEKSVIEGADCTEHNKDVYTVKGIKDVLGNPVQTSVSVDAVGPHTFTDHIDWSADGKKATVTRTCSNKNCKGAGTDKNGGYNKKPLVVSATVTKADQEDGAYLYTASLNGEAVGTKKVYDLTDAKVVVNGGEAVDNNIYPGISTEDYTDTAEKVEANKLPNYVISINGKEIDSELYTYVAGSYTQNGKLATFDIKAADDTEAYGTYTVKYTILKNKMFHASSGYWKIDNGTATEFNTVDVKKIGDFSSDEDIIYDGETHELAASTVYDSKKNDVTKKADVTYAVINVRQALNLKDPAELEYTDKAEFKDLGDYVVFAKFTANGFTDRILKIAEISVVKNYRKAVEVYIDNASVIEGDVPNLHLRVVSAEGSDNGEEIEFDPADFTISTVGGEPLTNLKAGEYKLIATSEVYKIGLSTTQKEAGYMGTLTVLPKDGSTAEERAAAESATALINALNENSTEAEVKAARDAYDKLSDTAKARVDADVVKKLTDAEDKIATDKVINQLNKATTDAEKAAAYEAYSKLSDAQKAAVDTAVGKDKVDAAKAAKDAADKKAADEAAAKKAAEELATAKTAANNSIAAAKGYESNAAVKSAIDALNAAVAKNDTAAIKTATTNLNNAVAAAKKEATSGPEKGKTYTVGGQKYLATSTTAVSMQKAKNAKTVTVPATVTINGKKASVTGIKKGTFGKKTKIVNIKSKKLTKKGVKNSLKGSKVKTVKVKCGKSYVKKYKKYFTKKNAGKKVTVK